MKDKIVTIEKLTEIIEKLKKKDLIVASTSGCFDILHAGHVIYLEEAKKQGDILVVLLNSDISVKKLKGEERPIVSEKERAIVIAGLESVDYVCLFNENTPCEMIERFKPDIFVKGGDYSNVEIPEMKAMSKYGGKVVYVTMVEGCSSTNVIEKIKRGR